MCCMECSKPVAIKLAKTRQQWHANVRPLRCFPCTQCRRAGITIMHLAVVSRYFSTQQTRCQEDQCSPYAIAEGFFWMLCNIHIWQSRISVTFIATLIRFVTTSLVCKNKNNGDILHHRKSVRAADEKPTINKLGTYQSFYTSMKLCE